MPTSYTTLLGLALPVTGELSGTWGDEVNNYITQYLDGAVAGTQTISGSQTAVTLSRTTNASLAQAGTGVTGSSQYQIINCTGNPATALTVTVPSTSKAYLVLNNTSTNQTVTVKGAATTGVTVAAARAALIAWNGTDFELVATDDASKMNGVLAAANGGTGQSSYTVGDILFASGTTTLSKLADVATGNALISGGVGVAPSYGKIGLTTHVSGTLPIANGGTNATATPTAGTIAYGTGSAYAFTSAGTTGQVLTSAASSAPTWTTATSANTASAIVQRDASGNFSAGTITATLSGNATNVSGTVAIANGGTGATTDSGARTNLGATTLGGNLFTITNPSAVTFPRFNADNTVSALDAATFRTAIGAGTGGGSVTSVSGTGTVNGITLTGTVTSSGSLTLGGTLSNVSLSTQVTGTLPLANGGTGQTTAQAAINSLAGAVTSGQYLRGNGTNVVMSAIQAGDVPTLNQNTTGTAANVTGIVAIANGGTGATTNTNARTNLGATTLGSNLFTITNPSAVTFPRFNADNTVSALDAATFRSAIGAGTSSTTGTVTSVGGTGSVNGITLSGTVTSSGNLTLGGSLSGVSLTTQVSGTLPIANGGTGQTTASAALNALGGVSTGKAIAMAIVFGG